MDNLENILAKAKEEINKNPNGHLTLPLRKELYKELGEQKLDSNDHALITKGLLRRTQLAVLCVYHVLYIWEEVAPEDNSPRVFIEKIGSYLKGELDWKSLWNMQNSFWTVLDNYSAEDRFAVAAYVGYACVRAVLVALYDEDLDNTENLYDEDLDAFSWDTAFFTSLACTDNDLYDEETKINKRREFWFWYINEAIPQVAKI